jgi:DNA-binding MarR family transcriptional regulator
MTNYSDLSPYEWKVLWQLGKIYLSDQFCYNFNGLTHYTDLSREQVKRAVRSLREKGLAEYHRGLFDCDGFAAGSGYSATKEGYELVDEMYRMVKE